MKRVGAAVLRRSVEALSGQESEQRGLGHREPQVRIPGGHEAVDAVVDEGADLNQAQAGQQVTVHRAGKIYRYKVVRKATFDRRREIPHRYFATTGPHRLVLVSCTAKVVFANGRFHYTHSLVVVAKPVQHRRQHQQLWARGRREPAGSERER